MKKITVLLAITTILGACQKEEEPLNGRYLTDRVGQVNMISEGGVDYQMQIYFDLSTGKYKAENKRDIWDLALGCNPSKANLFVNPAMLQRTAATGSSDFNKNFSISDYVFEYERAQNFYRNGRLTKNWINNIPSGEVYIVDLGKTLANQARGYKLLQITAFDENGYHLKMANLDHSDLIELKVPLNTSYNHVYISLSKPDAVLELEPPKEEWDIIFTKYMARLYDGSDTLDYSVTGALLNPYKSVAYFHEPSYRDSSWSYQDLRIEDLNESLYSQKSDVMGHDWKLFDLDAGAFRVIDAKNYFIRDISNQDYRLHFTGFYDDQGRKGGVSFEYLPL